MKNRVLLITGGARRIGADMARHFHRAGFNIALHYRSSEQAAEQLASELNNDREDSVICLKANLADPATPQALIRNTLDYFGRLDVLVNNASSFYPTPVGDIIPSEWDDLFSSNARAPLFLCQAARTALQRSGGCIINIIDIHADKPLAQHTVYCMAKAALRMMTLSLARELAPDIRVNGIAPGAILWPEQEQDEAQQQAILAKIPLARTGNSADIARTALFLAKDAPYITGQIIAVDGGRSQVM